MTPEGGVVFDAAVTSTERRPGVGRVVKVLCSNLSLERVDSAFFDKSLQSHRQRQQD